MLSPSSFVRKFSSVAALAAAVVVTGLVACETVTVGPGKPKDGGVNEDGSVEGEDGGDTDGGEGVDGGDGGPKVPLIDPPTNFKRTINCETNPAACSAGTCAQNLGPNCSGQSPCRGLTSGLTALTVADFPLKIRTPKLTAADTTCRTLCGPTDNTVFAISVQVKTPENNQPIAIKVAPPWKVSVGDDRYGPVYCLSGGDPVPSFAGSQCVAYYGSGNGTFAIVTSDPNAAATDVIVDLLTVDQWPTQLDGQCPYK